MLQSVTHRYTRSCGGIKISRLNPCWQGCDPYTDTIPLEWVAAGSGRCSGINDRQTCLARVGPKHVRLIGNSMSYKILVQSLHAHLAGRTVPECTPAASAGLLTMVAGRAVATGVAAEALTED